MRNSILSIALFLISIKAEAQYYTQYFDGADTNNTSAILVHIDTSSCNLWQIGTPQKTLFNNASSPPNVLITDTLNNYTDSLSCSFQFSIPTWLLDVYFLAIQWNQKTDMDYYYDGGILEFSYDTGNTWHNAFTSPVVYNFYGYSSYDYLSNGEIGFTGTTNYWENVWLCFEYNFLQSIDTLEIRFTFYSDTTSSSNEGWMIDNIFVHETWFHTIKEQSAPDNFKLYPNITTGVIKIEQKFASSNYEIKSIDIVDIRGNVVMKLNPNDIDELIDCSALTTGKYFVKIESNVKQELHPFVLTK